MSQKGKLFLIPSPLGSEGLNAIPTSTTAVLHRLKYLVAERAKTARHFIKSTHPPVPLSHFQISELNEHTPASELEALFKPVMQGHDLGLLSEAGCPGVADPGAELVNLAHRQGVEIWPLTGPSSILLALMASGMNGQCFCFHGYLSAKAGELSKDLKRLEQISAKSHQTQIFIETPYRNNNLIGQALKVLSADCLFCIACDLTLPSQYVRTQKISNWQKFPPPDLHKHLAVFLIYAGR